MPVETIKISELWRWPRDVVARKRAAILAAVRTTVRVHAPGLIQNRIAAYAPRQPVNTGEYKNAWKVQDTPDGAMVFNPTIQAAIGEHGRRPGFPVSQDAREQLARWVHLHGMDRDPPSRRERATRRRLRAGGASSADIRQRARGQQENTARAVAFLIARAITRRGIAARPVLAPISQILQRLVIRAVNRAIAGAAP